MISDSISKVNVYCLMIFLFLSLSLLFSPLVFPCFNLLHFLSLIFHTFFTLSIYISNIVTIMPLGAFSLFVAFSFLYFFSIYFFLSFFSLSRYLYVCLLLYNFDFCSRFAYISLSLSLFHSLVILFLRTIVICCNETLQNYIDSKLYYILLL